MTNNSWDLQYVVFWFPISKMLTIFIFDKWWSVLWMDVLEGPGPLGRPGSKTGSPSSASSINSTPSSCFQMGLSCLLLCHCHWMVRSPSSASSINPTLSSSSTWFLNIVIKVNILATAGDGWELWKPCLLSKLWTRKPENTKQGSESLHCNALYAMMHPSLSTLPNWTAL